MNRYDRQISVAEFGADGQKKLASAKILVVGAGGLASPVLQYLAGAGLGHIKVIDYDIVSVNNMHRQTIFRSDDLGLAKAGAAASHMRSLNPDCHMTSIIEPLTPDNIAIHASDVDLVLDCADSFAVSYCHSSMPRLSERQAMLVGFVIMRLAFVRFSLICHNGLAAVLKMGFWGRLLALSGRFRRK